MRNWGDVFYHAYLKTNSLKRPYGRLPTRPRALNIHVYLPHPMLHCLAGGILRRHLRGKRSPLSRPFKTNCTGTAPCDNIALLISYSHYGVVKSRLNMSNAVINVFLFRFFGLSSTALLLSSQSRSPSPSVSFISSCVSHQQSASDPCACAHLLRSSDREQANPSYALYRGSSLSPSNGGCSC